VVIAKCGTGSRLAVHSKCSFQSHGCPVDMMFSASGVRLVGCVDPRNWTGPDEVAVFNAASGYVRAFSRCQRHTRFALQ